MPVRYITVTPVTKLFKPKTRAFGDVAIVGTTRNEANGPKQTPVPITNPNSVSHPSNPDGNGRAVDDPGKVTSSTTLASDITDIATTIKVASTSDFPSSPPFTIRIDGELMIVTEMTGTDKTTWTVTRHTEGTGKAAHAKNASVEHTQPPWFTGNLGAAVRKAFEQTPGPTTVWAVRSESDKADDIKTALDEVAKLDVQIVTLANTPLKSATEGTEEIEKLASHVETVSNVEGDGKERIGVAMLGKDVTATTLITGNMKKARMAFIAHKSSEDAAAAVAGTIAGYEPHISLLLKQLSLDMPELFSDAEIDAFNKASINWVTSPTLIPGGGLFMGEGYTTDASITNPMPYIDIVRTIDDVSFRLKAQLIQSIGNLRVSRAGLRTLTSQMTAVLEPLKQREVIEAYDVFIPLLVLLDKDPTTLTAAERQQINDAQNNRVVDAIVSVDYAGAIHRLNITLKFE